jgi:hypothetical protein
VGFESKLGNKIAIPWKLHSFSPVYLPSYNLKHIFWQNPVGCEEPHDHIFYLKDEDNMLFRNVSTHQPRYKQSYLKTTDLITSLTACMTYVTILHF